MIKTVVWELKWPPSIIDALYMDDADHHGLIFWYNHVQDVIKEMNKKHPKKPL